MSQAAVEIFNNFRTKVGEKINLLDQKIENTLTLGQEIADLQNSLSDLNEYLHSSFLEGILDPIKIEGISNYINNLQVEKSSIDSKFQVVYNSSYLTDIVKQGLLDSKQDFDSKHTTLVTAIEDAIADGKGTEEELDQIQALFLEYRSAIGSYTLSIENALETITSNRIDSITVGTRNLLINSKTAQLSQDDNIFRFIFSAVVIRWDDETIRWDNTTVRWDSGTPNVSSELLEGDHIVSVDVTSNVSQAITLKLSDDLEPTSSSERVWELEAGRKTRVYVHVKAKWNNKVLSFEIEKHVSNSSLEITGLKLAEGNKSDSYSPAPEDVEQAIEETRINVTEAYKAYADAEAERKALEARAWADGKLTALEKKLLADATAKANAARRFAEAQDLHLQILTEAYADGKISALEAELIGLSEDNLEAAQNYVDAQIALEAIRADNYIDQEIETERQRAIDDANQKYSDAIAEAASLASDAQAAAFADAQNKYDAAILHANAQAELAKTEAIADADGKITAEEQARINALEAYEQAAQAYADAAQQLAETNAKAYADGEITDVEAALIADATAKMEEAKDLANSLADDLGLRIDDAFTAIDTERQRAIDDAQQKYDAAIAAAESLSGQAKDDAIADAGNLHDAAIAHANAQALLAQQTAIAHADGIVSDEEQARIDALIAYEAAAQAYADAAQQLAETNAAAYVDGEIDAEEARAIADATAKMEEAKNHAQNLADDLDIRVDDAFTAIDAEKDRAIADAQAKYTAAVAEAASLAGDAQATAIADAQTKYEAAVTHANAQALLAETNAIAHADGRITAEEAARIQALIAYEAAAEAYADAASELAEINAKAHADNEISEAEQRAINDATAKMNEAKALMNSLAADLQGDIDGNNAYLLQLAEDNLQAALDHANAQDDLLDIAIKAYADGIVSDSEARSLAAAKDEADRAERYADAQDALLDTAIKAYADGEISDAEARAIHEAELKVQAVRAELETLQTDLEAEIDGLTGRLSTLETTTLAALEDDILTETEIQNLRVEKRLLDKEKDDVDRRYLMIIGNVHLEGNAKSDLEAAEDAYQLSYSNLSNYYEDIFSTGEIPPGDPVALINDYSDALAEFAAAMDAALESISQKKSEIAQGNAIDYADNRLADEIIPAINDAQGAADDLYYLTEEAFWDGVFDQSEIQAYLTHIEPLNTEHEDIYSKYAVVYHNEFLTGDDKDNLYNAYDAYDSAHAGLITAILTIEEGDVTEGMKTDIRNSFTTYRTAINALRTAFEEASISIETGRIDNIIVGTRNLLLDADNIQFQNESSSSLIYVVNGTAITWSSTQIRWDDATVRWNDGIPNASSEDLSGQHAFGVRVRVPSQRVVSIELRDGSKTVKREYLVPAGKWQRIGATIDAAEGTTELTLAISCNNISQLQYEEVKLEIGNKWTDYNQSPEDVRSTIETARTNAQAAAESYAKAEAERQALLVKAHADGEISKMEKRLLDHADSVANAARRYSDAENTHLQILLEAWADGEISDLEDELIQLSNDNLDAAERAATAAANAAETAAKAYADGKVDDIEATLMGYADAAASAAESAAIAADAQLKGTMEAYADGKVEAEEQARIDALAAAADAAEAYADAAEQAAIVAAGNAADGKITAMEAALQSYADGAADAAKNAAIAADTALQGVLEAYADGKVSTEEANRIAALQAYADAAETYADAAADAAKVAAEAHADGEISDAEARAIADATQKMNEAKQLAQQLFDDLEDELDAVSANAQQAVDVANELSHDLESFGTRIGDNTVITGAVEVGSPEGGANAGINGVIDNGEDSIFLHGGEGFTQRANAPFRVTQGGHMTTESATIGDWNVKDGDIISLDEYTQGEPRVRLNGRTGQISLKGHDVYSSGGDSGYSQSSQEVSVTSQGVRASRQGGAATMSSNGIFANHAGMASVPATAGISQDGAMVGIGNGNLTKSFGSEEMANFLAGVIGRADNDAPASNAAPAYGGVFWGLKSFGRYKSVTRVTSAGSHYVNETDEYISCHNPTGRDMTVYLPINNVYPGRVIEVKRGGEGAVAIRCTGGGGSLARIWNHVATAQVNPLHGNVCTLTWDGQYWNTSKRDD